MALISPNPSDLYHTLKCVVCRGFGELGEINSVSILSPTLKLEFISPKLKIKLGNKKAMFFTMTAIIILLVFLLSYTVFSVVEDRRVINKRIDSMNNFVFSLEKDISRQGYISGYRAILSLESYITTNGNFLTNSQDSIKETILNGTINGVKVNLMEGYKLSDWNSRIQDFGNKMNLFINYSLKDVIVMQDDPWNIRIDMEIELLIKDRGNLATWNKTEIISSKVEVTNFEDPFYIVNTNGLVANKITKTIYIPFVQATNVSNLSSHVENSYYINSTTGPSFLDRFEGKTSPNPNGIESLVYLPALSSQGVSIKDKSVVDHIYFSDNNPDSRNIAGMPSWFKLDDSHLEIYNVTGLAA